MSSVQSRINRLERQRPAAPPPIVVAKPEHRTGKMIYYFDGKEVAEDELPSPCTMLTVKYG